MKKYLGVDIGGSGIKGAIVNTRSGSLLSEVVRIKTPDKSSPENVLAIINEICEHLSYNGNIGVGFPGVIHGDYIHLCNNLHKSWIGLNAAEYLSDKTGHKVSLLNDADAAGLAEIKLGAGRNFSGKVIVFTLGTSIGSAIFVEGKLFSGTEFGQMTMANGKVADKYAADSIRKKEDLSWKDWGARLNYFLEEINKLVYPDLIIISGGISKKHLRYEDELKVDCRIEFAQFKNRAGIIGAALAASLNGNKFFGQK